MYILFLNKEQMTILQDINGDQIVYLTTRNWTSNNTTGMIMDLVSEGDNKVMAENVNVSVQNNGYYSQFTYNFSGMDLQEGQYYSLDLYVGNNNYYTGKVFVSNQNIDNDEYTVNVSDNGIKDFTETQSNNDFIII
tara:strand:+ start:2210 stop:2617 length:408 start_codon:yes stop_codon:yes gene_type:complete